MPNDPANVRSFRRTLGEHLERHAAPDSDVGGALIVASELLTNAIQNSAGPVWVSLNWGSARPVLTVHDLGAGFDLEEVPVPDREDVRGRGLMITGKLVSKLTVSAKESGGSFVVAELPVSRAEVRDIDLPPSPLASLPDVEEMRADGTFGRESFLRALVVQLAQTVELASGPDAAEMLVAQVGTDVGGRMEDAFRATRDIDGDLDNADMAELFVELKAAIGGRFRVVEADPDRIVLVNSTCPFGDVVTRAPALCRMTSSVFGGIARRNRGAAGVDLEQRIAVGDPQCRVTVWLSPPGPDREPFVHMYGQFETPVEIGDRR
jgi:predicted ArsR family transcriptional regulator/anti-sigma regulatory factor (Ser/Thr protein kinase)